MRRIRRILSVSWKIVLGILLAAVCFAWVHSYWFISVVVSPLVGYEVTTVESARGQLGVFTNQNLEGTFKFPWERPRLWQTQTLDHGRGIARARFLKYHCAGFAYESGSRDNIWMFDGSNPTYRHVVFPYWAILLLLSLPFLIMLIRFWFRRVRKRGRPFPVVIRRTARPTEGKSSVLCSRTPTTTAVDIQEADSNSPQ